jgi:HSP20 family protein
MAKKSEKDIVVSKKEKELQKKATPAHYLSPFEEMERRMESLFDEFFGPRWMRRHRWGSPWWTEMTQPFEGRMPSVDVVDREDEILVRAELPGVDKKDLDVSMGDGSVTIKGSSSREEKEEKGDYYRREMSRGSFSRTVELPSEVDGSKAKATFNDGVLELKLPKIEKSKRRKIKVD